jgi:transposase
MSKIITHKFLISNHNRAYKKLDQMARYVNFVWNECIKFKEEIKNRYKVNSKYCYEDYLRYVNGITVPKKEKTQKIPKENNKDFIEHTLIIYRPDQKDMFKEIKIRNGNVSDYHLMNFLSGTSSMLPLPMKTINMIATEVDKSYKEKAKRIAQGTIKTKNKSNFISFRGRKNTGWIPFYLKADSGFKFDLQQLKITHKNKKFNKSLNIKIHDDGRLKKGKIWGTPLSGNFIQDKSGRWYACISFEIENYKTYPKKGKEIVGIDLGLKNTITTSNGIKIDTMDHKIKRFGKKIPIEDVIISYKSIRDKEKNKKEPNWTKIKKLNKKINRLEQKIKGRKNILFYTTAHKIADTAKEIKIGDVSGKFIQSVGGKSSKKASIGDFKEKIIWVATKRKIPVYIVNESYSTVTCSACGKETGPFGKEGLKIREWTCTNCGASHDRDINSAINISLAKINPKNLKSVIESLDL